MNVKEYRELLHEDIAAAARVETSSEEEQFLLYATGILIDAEEFDDFVECHYEGLTRRKGNMRIDGYAKDEADGSCCVFITLYFGEHGSDSIRADDINSAFKKIRLFIEECVRTEAYFDIHNKSAADFARELFYDSQSITKYRFFLITDAFNRQLNKNMKDDKIGDKTVELNVWDIERLYDVVISKSQKESIEIDFKKMDIPGIPCVKAVDCQNVVADIEIAPKSPDELYSDGELPENIITYTSYLAVVPGQVLCDLYLEYGAKLLEGNVRSFLSVRGKVNKGIQATIKNYPDMFFAYNNGIAATATEVETELSNDGLCITKIWDLQIVNGGQTTASLANTMLSAKKKEIVHLEKVFVPMKISVLERSMSEKIIPKISEYSNSQNKVDASDFFSNHPFHIRMEGFSRKTPVPSGRGMQFQQYWFYERTRGQYNQGKMKLRTRSELKQYTDRYPENQVIKMLDLAKYMEIYQCHPDIVSKGKQKTLQLFAEDIKKDWAKTESSFNAYYYKRVVALAIIYKRADELIKQSKWYKETRSYKANVIAYTLSIIFYYIANNQKGYELDFMRIWNTQDTYPELDDQMELLAYNVYKFITGPRETENVTEWCKKEMCWTRARSQQWTIEDPFIASLVPAEDVHEEKKKEKKKQKFDSNIDVLSEVITRGPDYWKKVIEWDRENRKLSPKEKDIIRIICNIPYTGRIPSEKQARVAVDARQRLIREGMPMEFN